MAYFASVGRIDIAPALYDEMDRRRMSALAPAWAADESGEALALRRCLSIEAAATDLRRVVRGFCKPRGIVLDGVQVIELADGSVTAITARSNRVSVRRLLGPGRELATRLPCDVIALDRWQSGRSASGDVPVG